MSLNEGENFTLSAAVTYKAPDTVPERVEFILWQAQVEIQKIDGATSKLDITSAHDDCDRLNAQLDYLSQFMTDDQVKEFYKI